MNRYEVKKFLERYKNIATEIERLKGLKKELELAKTSVRAVDYSKTRVKSVGGGYAVDRIMDKIISIDKQLLYAIYRKVVTGKEIYEFIQQLGDENDLAGILIDKYFFSLNNHAIGRKYDIEDDTVKNKISIAYKKLALISTGNVPFNGF